MERRPIKTIRNQVYQILKDDICEGRFAPGQWLQENELAERLCVSRSPIREALRQLASDGLVVEIPNKGVFVKEFTVKDIEEIYDLRTLLESYAIKNSVKTLTSINIQELMDILQKLVKCYEDNDLAHYIEIDSHLHQYIITLGGNSLVVDIYRRVYSQSQQFRIYSLTTQRRFDDSVTEHRGIVENLIAGNWKEADRINRIHLSLAREEIIEHFEAKKEEDKESEEE